MTLGAAPWPALLLFLVSEFFGQVRPAQGA
jgi:hypothetical protein